MSRLFNGTTQYLSRTSAILTSPPITMACWGYSDDNINPQDPMSLGDSASSQAFRLIFKGNAAGDPIGANIIGSVSSGAAETTTGYSVNTWHHACGVYAAINDIRVYIDGGSKGTNTNASGGITPDRTGIGCLLRGSPSTYFSGRIAEAAIWNVALTDGEVAILGLGYSPLFVRPQSLVAYWPLTQKQSPEIDWIAGNDLSLNNGPTVSVNPPVIYPTFPPSLTGLPAQAVRIPRPPVAAPDIGGMIVI